jgi:hypothetical protein
VRAAQLQQAEEDQLNTTFWKFDKITGEIPFKSEENPPKYQDVLG